jgi:hypothetical protein
MKIRTGFAVILLLATLIPGIAAQYYSLPVMAITNSPSDSVTNYIGNRPVAPTTTANTSRIFIPATGTVRSVNIYDYSGTAGTNEAYVYYIRVNNATDYLVNSISSANAERIFQNLSINIPVTRGDFVEVKRVHPVWSTNPLTNIVGGSILIESTTSGYVVPVEALSNSPGDSAQNYMGFRPIAPATTQGTNKIYVPASGNITVAYIYDYSATVVGTPEPITYSIQVNGGNQGLIGTVASNTSGERIFSNTSLNVKVFKGDYIEIKRDNPLWDINPTGNTVGGVIFVDTSLSTDPKGYNLYIQGLTSSPADAQTVYIGGKPAAPSTTGGVNKIFVQKGGIVNHAELYVYSGTAGTNEEWPIYLRLNGTTDYLISSQNQSAGERLFKNWNMNIPVSVGNYIEIKSVQPTWATNPATTIYGGYIYVQDSSNPTANTFIIQDLDAPVPWPLTIIGMVLAWVVITSNRHKRR